MITKKLEVGTKVFLQNEHGLFLLLKRAKPYRGERICRWDIPGGRVKPGETQMEALQREVKEETGLRISGPSEILGVQDILQKPETHTVRITYLGFCSSKETISVAEAEHSAYRWFSLEELTKIKHDQFLNPIIEKLQER